MIFSLNSDLESARLINIFDTINFFRSKGALLIDEKTNIYPAGNIAFCFSP